MKVAVIFNKDLSGVINRLGMQNKEKYNPKTINLVAEALEAGGHTVAIIDGNMHVITKLQEFLPLMEGGDRMGIVFNLAYGIQGESRYTHIPSMLEMLGIPYIGSSPSGHTFALDKVTTKIIIQKYGLPTPDFWFFASPEEDMSMVEFPVVVKPKMEALSFGVRVANNPEELWDAVKAVTEEFQQQALVEKFIRGREFAVGLIGNNPTEAFPVVEIDLDNNPDGVQTVENKRKKPLKKICPANIPQHLADEMVRISIGAFKALQLRDFARVDIRMDMNNNIYILEINSMSSLGKTGSYIYAAEKAGYNYHDIINKILDVGLARYITDPYFKERYPEEPMNIPAGIKIRAFLRNKKDDLENLLRSIVNTNCHVRNVTNVNSVGEMISAQLEPLGFRLQVFPQLEVGNILYFNNSGKPDLDVLLLGHIDEATLISEHEYYMESDPRIFGSGIWSCKGGLVVMIGALQALHYIDGLKKLKVGVLLTTDDTLQAKIAHSTVRQISSISKYVLGLNGASVDGGVVTSRSGAAVYSCFMNLINPKKAEDVSWSMGFFANLIHALTQLTNTAKGFVVSPYKTEMRSNITDNYGHGEARFSVRFNDPAQVKCIEDKIKELVSKEYLGMIDFQYDGGIRRPPMIKTKKADVLLNILAKIAGHLDIRMQEEHRWSSADIGFVDGSIPVVDGMGPEGSKTMSKSEFILRQSLLERATFLAMTLMELKGSGQY